MKTVSLTDGSVVRGQSAFYRATDFGQPVSTAVQCHRSSLWWQLCRQRGAGRSVGQQPDCEPDYRVCHWADHGCRYRHCTALWRRRICCPASLHFYSYLFCLVGGVAVSALGIAASPVLLRLINTPEEIFADSVLYLRIYFIGTLFNILYNMGAGVLQAVADTRHPLYYLCAASAVNIVLDVVFVAVFRWGVAGVAAATLIAQTVSATLAYGSSAAHQRGIPPVQPAGRCRRVPPDFKVRHPHGFAVGYR